MGELGFGELQDEQLENIGSFGVGETAKGNSNIKVTGHTDNVPLLFGSQYRDNWDLAAARAASVVQNLQETNVIDAKRLIATSKGETQPIASNQTRQGRSKNRRIEIEINYGK